MKKLKISLTVVVELALIYLFSLLVGWSFIETFFLGSLGIFGTIWLIALNINQNANIDHTIYKTGEVKPFRMTWSPYTVGAASLTAFSFIVTAIYYLPYFL
ncbi:hypothetical protein COJ67_18230 [Bacillus thuringiensis]|uniref:hypothetical protein n=1 Tax=Bacillus thuringiensis TaxID=1428 RepID=UPI000BEC665F|nr:hypothetical protein [Bacillus thuringiensis]PEF13136.1 hypothetical protein CON23_06500 [Bacillus thuringiensis]PFN86185.1 hypothetical protein COJ67_18230 [Bacillus thuringiensis]PGX92262.1 hypothetical protein COE41_27565 [Bacillus thuringiensis]